MARATRLLRETIRKWEYLARKNRTLDYYYYYYYFFPTSMDAISRNYLIILNAAFIDH